MANADPYFSRYSVMVFNHFRDASSRYYYRGDILQNPEYNLLDIYVFPITHLPRNIISCVNALRYDFIS